jgi:hypothetical protein
VHTPCMGQRSTKRHRVFIEDARRNGSYLRATWHPDRRIFVLSTWNDDVCTGAIRLPAAEAVELVGLIVDGLGEMAGSPRVERGGRRADLRTRLTRWFRSRADQATTVLPLRNVSRTSERRRRSA